MYPLVQLVWLRCGFNEAIRAHRNRNKWYSDRPLKLTVSVRESVAALLSESSLVGVCLRFALRRTLCR